MGVRRRILEVCIFECYWSPQKEPTHRDFKKYRVVDAPVDASEMDLMDLMDLCLNDLRVAGRMLLLPVLIDGTRRRGHTIRAERASLPGSSSRDIMGVSSASGLVRFDPCTHVMRDVSR